MSISRDGWNSFLRIHRRHHHKRIDNIGKNIHIHLSMLSNLVRMYFIFCCFYHTNILERCGKTPYIPNRPVPKLTTKGHRFRK